jgi:hypothetical protein
MNAETNPNLREIYEMHSRTNKLVNFGIATGGARAGASVFPKNTSRLSASVRRGIFCMAPLLLCGAATFGQTSESHPIRAVGPGQVVVHSKFGGQIFGFDVDQNGTEGLLSESKLLSNGNVLAAVETFDQATGDILSVVAKTKTQDDFITLGVAGNGIGLIEHEHVQQMLSVKRTFHTLNPLASNKLNGIWTPPIGSKHLIPPAGVSRNQGEPDVAVFASDNSGHFIPDVFESNVAANTFGPVVRITDSNNFGSVPPPFAFDRATKQAILGGGPGCFDCFPVIGLVDLVNGTFSEFTGTGFGFINGLAVDSADGIFCTTTEDDANVEFYNPATQQSTNVVLPGSNSQQFFSGADVEFDSINKLFLIAQPNSSSAPSGSTIYVYSPSGVLQETLNGFNFSNTFNVVPAHIALHPNLRSGYVDGPDTSVSELQSFTY